MARMLTRLGHHVDLAENGERGLDRIREACSGTSSKPIDMIFLDK